jgi:class I fructose-bisphosphate aldolase
MSASKIHELLGDKAGYYPEHTSITIDKSSIHIPSATHLDDVWTQSNRNVRTLGGISTLMNHGRLTGSGYVSILFINP